MEKVSLATSPGMPPQPSLWLRIGSGLAITSAVLWTLMCLWILLDVKNVRPFAFLGAVAFGPIGAVFAFLQFRAVFCSRKDIAYFNGIALILFSLLTVFGVVAIIGEVMIEDDTFTITLNVLFFALCVMIVLGIIPLCLGISTFRWGRALERYAKTEPLCNYCGYSLRGTIKAGELNCPECGKPYHRS